MLLRLREREYHPPVDDIRRREAEWNHYVGRGSPHSMTEDVSYFNGSVLTLAFLALPMFTVQHHFLKLMSTCA